MIFKFIGLFLAHCWPHVSFCSLKFPNFEELSNQIKIRNNLKGTISELSFSEACKGPLLTCQSAEYGSSRQVLVCAGQ